MRKLISAGLVASGLMMSATAFAVVPQLKNARGEVVQAEVKGDKLVDAKGNSVADGEFTFQRNGKAQKIVVKNGKIVSGDQWVGKPGK